MSRFEQALANAIEEMTDEVGAPSRTLAGNAIAKGRRLRRRRRLLVIGAGVLACATLALPWVYLSQSGGTPIAAPPVNPTQVSPTVAGIAGVRLPGGWVVVGYGRQVLDRRTGNYVQLSGNVQPAPVGNRVAYLDSTGQPLRISDVDGSSTVSVNTTGIAGLYQWNRTGDRLLGRANQKTPDRIGFSIIDAVTGAVTKHWIDTSKYDCSECSFTWTPDGKEVVMAIAARSGEGYEHTKQLQFFDAGTGKPSRSLAVTAMPDGPYAWSPDGHYLIASADIGSPNAWQIVDLTIGTTRPYPHDAVWISPDLLAGTQGGNIQVTDPAGNIVEEFPVDADPGPGLSTTLTLGPPA